MLGLYPLWVLMAGVAWNATPEPATVSRSISSERRCWIPLQRLSLVGPVTPSDAEATAIQRFAREIERITHVALPVVYGPPPRGPVVLIGNRSTLASEIERGRYGMPSDRDGEDIARQSYVVAVTRKRGGTLAVLAAGLGSDRTARQHLGTGYALGELLRRLDLNRGQWGFSLPEEPIVATPAVAHRTLYVMNSSLQNPGLSLEYFTPEQIDEYVDRLVEARFSRVCLFQWSEYYLYPGNAPSFEADRQRVHRAMRRFFDRARQRGMEVYYQLTPSHANPDVLSNGAELRARGYYAPFSVCWSKPEARRLATDMARLEMTYYGPADGYMVWFYDPGGCFCEECAAHQSERIFDQLLTVVKLAEHISPGARFQAGLWPTWAFAHDKERIGHPGRGYTEEEVKTLVSDFLRRCLATFGRRRLTIIDTLEGDGSNIYNGNVRSEDFLRSGFLYTVQGMPSEHVYPYPWFRLGYIVEQMARAQERGLDEAQIFIQYSAANFPSVYAFADSLYAARPTYESVVSRLVQTLAKGPSQAPFRAFLDAVEDLGNATTRAAAEQAVSRMETFATQVLAAGGFVGDADWLRGYVLAQKYYLQLAGTTTDADFNAVFARFRDELGALPMYSHFAKVTLRPDLVRGHLRSFWSALMPAPKQ